MWALIPNPSTLGQTICLVMSVLKIFRNKQEHLDYSMDDVNVLRQAWCLFRNLFFETGKDEHISASFIFLQKRIWIMFLKSDTLSIITRRATVWRPPVCRGP
jgi:hypothetical protein